MRIDREENMMNIIPPVYPGIANTKTPSHTRLGDVAVSKHLPKKQFDLKRERRKGVDRRNHRTPPILELRVGRDRRANPAAIDTSA